MFFAILAALAGPSLIPFAVLWPHNPAEASVVAAMALLGSVGATLSILMPRLRWLTLGSGAVLGLGVFFSTSVVSIGMQGTVAILFITADQWRGDDQRRFFCERRGIGQMQPVRTDWQIGRPGDHAIIGLARCDNLKTRNDFPAHRKRGSVA